MVNVTSADPGESSKDGINLVMPAEGLSQVIYVGHQTTFNNITVLQDNEYIQLFPVNTDNIYDEKGTISVTNSTPQPTVILGPLELAVTGGGAFVNGSATSTATSAIELGLAPQGSNPFVPLLNLDGTLSYTATSISAQGTVTTNLGGSTTSLWTGRFDINTDPSSGTFPTVFNLPSYVSNQFTIAGVTVTIESVAFADGQLQIQGNAVLDSLGGATVAIDGSNYVAIDSNGISMTGAVITGPAGGSLSFNLAGVDFTASQLSADYVAATPSAGDALIVHGTVAVTVGNNVVTADFTGNNFIEYQGGTVTANATVNVHDFAIPGPFGLPGDWSITNASLQINTSVPSVQGTCTIVGPQVSLVADFTPNGTSLAFSADPNSQFTMAGITIYVTNLYFDTDGNFRFYGLASLPDNVGVFSLSPNGIQLSGGQIDFSSFDLAASVLGLEITGQQASLTYDLIDDQFVLQGNFGLPGIFSGLGGISANLTGNDSLGRPYGIVFNTHGVSVNGAFTLPSLTIPNTGYGLINPFLAFDPNTGSISGGAGLEIPGLPTIQAALTVTNGTLSGIEVGLGDVDPATPTGFQLGSGNLDWSLGTSGAVLQGISGSIDTTTLALTCKVDLTYGPAFDVSTVGTVSLAELVLSGTISSNGLHASGTANFLGGWLATGQATIDLDWAPSWSLSANIHLNFADDLIVLDGTMSISSGGFLLHASASFSTPEVNILGFRIPSQPIANVDATVSYVTNAPLSQDYVSVSVGLQVFNWLNFTAGLRVTFDGGVHPFTTAGFVTHSAAHLVQNAVHAAGIVPLVVTPSASDSVTIPAGTTAFLLAANWTNAAQAMPAVSITAPDGTVYTAANFDNNVRLVNELTTSTSLTIGLQNPKPGKWTIKLPDTTGLGKVTFQTLSANLPPAIKLTGADVHGSQVTIHYQVQNSDPQARIEFLYGTDSAGKNGQLIKAGIPAATGASTFTWNTASVSSGQYYISAVIDDGHNPDSTDHLAAPVVVPNQPPKLNPLTDKTVVAGTLLSFTATASDPDHERLTFSLGASTPAGVTTSAAIDAVTGKFTWTPDASLPTQDITETVIVTDSGTGALTATRTFTIHVIQPVFTSAAAATFTVGSGKSVPVSATALPKPTLHESANDSLPGGVTFNAKTGTLHGTPAAGTAGTYTLHFTADYPGGRAIAQTFVLTVAQPALFTSARQTIFTAGTPGTFTVTAIGSPTAATLKESTSDKLPTGVAFNAASGTLTSTAATPAGTYTLHFIAHNGIGSDATQAFTLIVGQPPAFTGAAATTFTIGKFGSAPLKATGLPKPTFREALGDTLPAGVKFNAATGVLSGTPATGTAGTYLLHFTVHNGAGTDTTETFVLTIVNHA